MNFQEFQKLAETYNAIPVSRRLLADVMTPVSVFLSIRDQADFPFLLESVEGGEQLARYSFLGRDPYQVFTFDGKDSWLQRNGQTEKQSGSYFDLLKELTSSFKEPDLPELPRLTGGAVGFSAYDTVRLIEDLPNVPPDDVNLPEAIWAFYDEIVAFDHVKQQLILMKTVFIDPESNLKKVYDEARQSLDCLEKTVKSIDSSSRNFELDKDAITSNITRPDFEQMVDKAKSHIYEGDIFQVVLSQRFEVPFSGDKFMLYRALRMVNPSPYLFYLEFDGFSLVGSSPEVLVRVQQEKVHLLPIAGTRPRGKDREEDLALEEDLKKDPKEVAEHIMLVDLGRNDLSRVCKAGSVKLVRNQVIERYSHVMHIVSDVTGELDT
ncbi:MAG: chorismate-binding protein, partial [Balneolaceae bacterium]